MSCKQLGGACDITFRANTFGEMAELSKTHGMEMFQHGGEAHLEAMNKMKYLMSEPGAMAKWMDSKRAAFEAAPEDE